jgi:hypothetical protein
MMAAQFVTTTQLVKIAQLLINDLKKNSQESANSASIHL